MTIVDRRLFLPNEDKREYGHRCDQQKGIYDGPNQRRKRDRLIVMVSAQCAGRQPSHAGPFCFMALLAGRNLDRLRWPAHTEPLSDRCACRHTDFD